MIDIENIYRMVLPKQKKYETYMSTSNRKSIFRYYLLKKLIRMAELPYDRSEFEKILKFHYVRKYQNITRCNFCLRKY